MSNAVLVINAGSSSIKFALYALVHNNSQVIVSGKIVNIGQWPLLDATDAKGQKLSQREWTKFNEKTSHEELVQWLLEWIARQGKGFTIKAVGHRVVHGGQHFLKATKVTPTVLSQLKELIPLAPLHQGHNLSAIEAISKWQPSLPQLACFDTSFHHTQPTLHKLFALPREYSDKGIIRYGFHGLSYQYIASQLPKYLGSLAEGRVIVAHLGNGASMCALSDRQSMATSMGFTALDGLMMGQRCGNLDAGVILHILREYNMNVDDIEQMLYKESGLLGVSGISNNMHVLQQSKDPHAKQAIDLFCYRAARELSSLATSINGVDAIVFTAGIGENSSLIRHQICEHLAWLGVTLDAHENVQNSTVISHTSSGVKVLVIPTNEELIIANATQELVSEG